MPQKVCTSRKQFLWWSVLNWFWQIFFILCTNPRFLSLELLLKLLNPICHFASELMVLNLLQTAISPSPNQNSPFSPAGNKPGYPLRRIWWKQGGCDLWLPTSPPLAPAQRVRNSDLSFGHGRVPACPLPATSYASSALLPWKGMTDTTLVTLTWRVFKLRICSEVQGPVKVLRYLPSPDLPFLPALLFPFLSPQPWNETENYFFKTVSIIYV